MQDSNMKKKVISYFNKELKFYEGFKIVENQDNRDIKQSCKRYLNMCPLKESYPCMGREIRIIGELDDENQNEPLSSYKEPVLVVDCDTILKVRFPQVYGETINTTN